jgi:hypothetical protein
MVFNQPKTAAASNVSSGNDPEKGEPWMRCSQRTVPFRCSEGIIHLLPLSYGRNNNNNNNNNNHNID